jgi:hypothetical protein
MTQLQSTKSINNLKERAIKNGGYSNVKFKSKIISACEEHLSLFGVDLMPKHI